MLILNASTTGSTSTARHDRRITSKVPPQRDFSFSSAHARLIIMATEYAMTVGLEIHVELKTNTKMFCNCLNDPDEKRPNSLICPVCCGSPGTLPTINKEAINKIVKVGLALNCAIARYSKFDRKNYFYPDLPKGYQISQYDLPLCFGGKLAISPDKTVRIERIHMEEDAGRLQHGNDDKHSLVDYNRAGVPLMELVTKPDITSSEQIGQFAKELRLILRHLGASDADMEKGQMRVEVNISIRPKGAQDLGTKVEVKNINSISAAMKAAEYEFKRQVEALERGDTIVQETRGWDDTNNSTYSQRIKEGSADYRYFPEPDLPPLTFTDERIAELRAELPELPSQRRERFMREYGLNAAQVEVFTTARHLGDYFENVVSELGLSAQVGKPELDTLAANYIITEFPPLMEAKGLEIDDLGGLKITAENFAELVAKISNKELSSTAAKTVLKEMSETGDDPDAIMQRLNLGQISDASALTDAVDDVISTNPKPVEQYKAGKTEVLKFLVGKVMAATKGKGNPEIIMELLKQKLT